MMYLVDPLRFLVLVTFAGSRLCQRLAARNLLDFQSKFVVDDEYQPFLASEIEESPVWNYDSDYLGYARGGAIDSGDLSDASDDSLADQLDGSQLGGAPDAATSATPASLSDDTKSGPKEPNNLKDVNSLRGADDEQQFEQFGQFQDVNRSPKLQVLFENKEQLRAALRNPYRNLNENSFAQFPLGRKAPRELPPLSVPRNSFVDFVRDDEYDDFYEPNFGPKEPIKNEKNATDKSGPAKNESNQTKMSEEPKTRSNDKRQAGNRTVDAINFDNYGFDDLSFKLDDDLDEKTTDRLSDPSKNANRKEPDDKKESTAEEKKDGKQTGLLKNSEIVPILKHKPKFTSRVVYSDNDEILITEDKKNNATTISLPKTTDFVDEPSKEPRIRKLRRLRRLRKQPRPKLNSFADDEFATNRDDLPGRLIDQGLRDSLRAAIDDEQRVRNDLKSMKQDAKNMKSFAAKTESLNEQTQKTNADGKSPDGEVVKNSSKSRVIRIVKVVKKNPETQQIESNVTLIDSRDGSNDTLKSDLNSNDSKSKLKGVSKDELKSILDDVTRDVLKDESKTVLKGAPMIDRSRHAFGGQTSGDKTIRGRTTRDNAIRDRTTGSDWPKNETPGKLPSLNNDDIESKKSEIKRVLY